MDLRTEGMNTRLLMVSAAVVFKDVDSTRARGKDIGAGLYLLENAIMLVVPGILGDTGILSFSSASSGPGQNGIVNAIPIRR